MACIALNIMINIESKPLIRWAGSKRKLLPQLLERVPDKFERYIEPFCGSACLFFELGAPKAILSDINDELINTYKQLKKHSNIREELIKIPVNEETYYRFRDMNPNELDRKERAIRFFYLNRYCFNGIYRTNSSGKFNVPMGSRTGDFPCVSTFNSARKKLFKARLVTSDYKKILDQVTKGDFVYMDPPYSKSDKFTGEYGVGSFNVTKLPQFLDDLREIDIKGAKFLFSYRACKDTADELAKDFHVERVRVMRHISGFKTEWNEVEEILVRNFKKES